MRIAEINMLHYGSTGKIMFGIADTARAQGHDVCTFSPKYYQRGCKPSYPRIKEHRYFGNRLENMVHLRLSQVTGLQGCFSLIGTCNLVRELQKYKPDIIHLHNLHNWTVNLPILFRYIKKQQIPVVWTLHDCWAFTGKCPYFDIVQCEKWKTGCSHCPQVKEYPQAYVDATKYLWGMKKHCFSGVQRLVIVTPSQWLASLVSQSFLNIYQVKVIHNGIDLNLFEPTKNNFRIQHQIPDNKKILLGVAFGWGHRKGLECFVKLSRELNSEQYQIVLVGTDDCVDSTSPRNILSIHATRNQQELAEIYSAADLFVNPTLEDNFPTVNIEALACGTPVLTYRTGGSAEILDTKSGVVVEYGDYAALKREIVRICTTRPFRKIDCVRRAKQFDQQDRFREYVNLFRELIEK